MGEVIVALLIVGLFVMLIGHGMWLIAAAIIRQISGAAPQPPAIPPAPAVSPTQKLYELQRHVARLHQEGVLNAQQREQLLDVLRKELIKLRPSPPQQPVELKPSAPPKPTPAATADVVPEQEAATELVFEDEPPPAPNPFAAAARVTQSAPPSEPLTHVLRAFMEQRNIRWGELISGMLIVGSSIGLVVSLWSKLSQVAYFPALLFLSATAAIHGAGVYTLRKWKLRSTSRGLLVIAGLLIPLNYLAAIALSQQRPISDPLYIASIVVGTLAFGAMAWSGGRILLLNGTVPYFIALWGISSGQLLISRQVSPGMPTAKLLLMTCVPFACYLFALIAQLRQGVRWPHLSWRRAGQIFMLLAIATFSLLVALGLVAWKLQDLPRLLADLSPILNLALVPALGLGLVVHNRATARSLVKYQTAGTAIAVLAAGLMLGTLAAAWPRPELLVAIGLIDFVALSLMAERAGFSPLHAAAALAAAFAGLLGYHLAAGTLDLQLGVSGRQLFDVLVMGRSSVLLSLFSILAAAAAGGLYRFKKQGPAAAYGIAAAGLAVVSIAVAAYAGFWTGVDRNWTTPVFALSSAVLLIANLRIRRAALAWAASGFVLVALIHGLVWNTVVIENLTTLGVMPTRPWLAACLLHATFGCATALGVWRREHPLAGGEDSPGEGLWHGFAKPLGISALVTSAIVVPRILWVSPETLAPHAGYAFWATAVWLGLAYLWQSRWGFAAAQALATIALGFIVTSICRRSDWWAGSYLDPWHLQAQMAAMAVWGMLWAAVRWSLRKSPRWSVMWTDSWTTVDRVVLGVSSVASVILVTAACVPGLDAELRRIPSAANAVGIHPILIGSTIAFTVGLVVAASLALIPKRRIALFSGMSVLTAAWALPIWDDAARIFWHAAGIDSTFAFGWQAWLVLAVLLLALVVAMWERYSTSLVSVLLFLTMTIPVLIAGPFGADRATATLLRWGLALHALIIAAIVCGRGYWMPAVKRLCPRGPLPVPVAEGGWLRSLAITLTLTPLLALTLRHLVLLARPGVTVALPVLEWGTIVGSHFAAYSLGVPLLLMTAAFVLYAARERSAHFAIAALLMLNLAASTVVIVANLAAGLSFATAGMVSFFQWNAVVSAAGTVACLLARRWIEPQDATPSWSALHLSSPLEFPVQLAGGLTAFLATWAAAAIIAAPAVSPAVAGLLGGPLSFVALALAILAACLYYRDLASFSRMTLIPIGALSAATFLAAAFERWQPGQPWGSYHVLISGWSAISVIFAAVAVYLTYAVSFRTEKISAVVIPALVRWATVIGGLVVLLAVRGLWHLPAEPWWSTVPVGVASLTAAALALRGRDQRYAYASTGLAMLATSFLWLTPWLTPDFAPSPQAWVELLEACLLAMTLAGTAWLGVELFWQRRLETAFDQKSDWPPLHHAAAGIGVIAVLALAAFGLIAQHQSPAEWVAGLDVSNQGAWWTVAALGGLLAGSLWDVRAQHVVAGLYALCVAAVGLWFFHLELTTRHLVFGIGVAAGGGVLLSGAGWSLRHALSALAQRLRIQHAHELVAKTDLWLRFVVLLQTAICVAIGFWVVLSFTVAPLRFYGATAVAATALGTVAFAQHERRLIFRTLALLLAAVAAVDVGWALMEPAAGTENWLHRAVRLLEIVAILACTYGGVLLRWLPDESTWYRALRRAGAVLMTVTVTALLAVLALEADLFVPGQGTPLRNTEIAAVVVVLVLFAAALISMAVLPGRDPLGLSERGRMFYVYIAEMVMALLFLHIYLTKPEWFHGRIRPYWPLVVMAIAFFGVGAGEILRRSKIRVLADPLQNTGAFLPLLPALGFWLLSSNTSYSTVLFVVGLLYVVMSLFRHQLWYGILAGLAGNAGLWALWQEHGTPFWEHPQLWMIPPALSVLAAAQWHREKLSEAQLTAMRYASIIVIYVSSTGDMFITGIAENLWMPIILAALSVAGVFAGILLRIRAFVYLGTSFLFVSIVSMIWHAAQSIDHVWPWWAFGIVLGLLILTLFGVFEKKRQEVLRLVGEFRQWEA